jgi:hypothetical protein
MHVVVTCDTCFLQSACLMGADSLSCSTSSVVFDLQSIYKTALKEYIEKTNIDIAAHSLTTWSSKCHDSDHEVISILREQAEPFREFHMGNASLRVMTWLKPTIRVVHTLPGMFGDDRDRVSLI